MGKARNLSKLMSDNIVGTTELADNAVTTAKLANDAVTAAKLDIDGGDISYDNSTSGISASTLQEAIDYLNVLSGGGSAGAQATYTREEFNATAGQTTFTTVNGYTLGYLQVFMNGIMLDSGDYTANDESTVVLATGAAASDEVTTIAYDSFAISEVLRVLNISASAPDDILTLSAGGYNGLNSTSPASVLEIVGNDSSSAKSEIRVYYGPTSKANNKYLQVGNYGASSTIYGRNGQLTLGTRYGDPVVVNTNNTARLTIDASGRVTTPYQPAFRAHTFTPMSGEAPIIFTVAAHNIGSHYNVSNGKFTAPVAGLYHFDFSVLMATGSNTAFVRVLFSVNGAYGQTRNGDTLTGGAVGAFTNYTYHAVQMSHSFYLSANDTVGIINANPNGQTYQSSGGYGSFSGYLIG